MKRFILFFLSLVTACVLGAQVTSQNYIRSRKMLNNTGTSYVDNIAYYDGLGRPFQTVTKSTQTGTVKERLATLQEYDAMGRETKMWLPTPVTADYVAAAGLKTTSQGSTGYSDTRPYSETVYEASPLSRVNKQYGAGAAWYSGHPVATDYLTNTSTGVQACKLYTISGTTLSVGSSYYTAGTLYVVKTTDEDGNASYTFTDKQERTVLTRQMNGTEQLDTYFVYDAKGNLCFVLQPEYQETADLSLYAFQYKYDNRNRCTWKKLPGAEYISYEYNDYDQLVCSSDSVQRSAGKETFYAYDKFGRLTQQGEKTVQTETVYLQNFYDDHIAFRAALPNDIRDQYPNDTSDNAKGSLTGTIMNVFDSSEKIYTVYYYDIKGRVIKTIENNLMGGYNTKVTTYTFTDQPATVTLTHTANGKATQTEVYTYTYDHSDRISSVSHKLNNGSAVTLASYTYDNVGRMATKKLHGSSSNQLTYAYNVRSWLTGISSGKFSQNLTYNNGSTGFNGNITAMNWTADGTSHAYTFSYDGVSRMLNATHGTGAYTEKVTGYDKNGNINGLQRYDNSSLVDNLIYTYSGNQLTKVEDASNNTAGFKNGVSTTNEYIYDANGNLTKDSNKGIASITYNCLNLPQVVTFSNGSTITYLYAADGRKLRTVHVINGFSFTTDYSGNVIYESGVQKLLLTEEGYVDLVNSNTYYYYLKDHQGNNRVVVSSSGAVQEVNHYYPFGGTFATSSSSVQPYKYNGKELDTKNGLNWYDYGARHYDAVLGRWFVVDPLGEERYSNSVYSYTNNTPINKIDPNGMLDDWVEDREGNIYWDKNAISQATTKHGETYLGKTVVVFEGSTDERLGKNSNINDKDAVTAKVTLYNSEGEIKQYKGYTMSSDPKLFGVVADGYYNVNRIGKNDKKGPYGSEWTLNKRGEVPAMNDYNPAHSERKPGYLIGVFIHRPNNNGFAGTYWDKEKGRTAGISEGCLLIAPHQWNDFQNQLIGLNKFKLILNRK